MSGIMYGDWGQDPEDLADLIACPLCRATITEPCKSAGGNWVPAHDVRLITRRCPCSNVLPAGSRFCTDQCRNDARAATFGRRELRTPTSERRAA